MLLNPYRFGATGGGLLPLPIQTVDFVIGNYSTIGGSASSRSMFVPTSAAEGDLMVATVNHSTAVTAPSGWTFYFNGVNGSGSQQLSVYFKTATSGDPGSSHTWTMASSAQFVVHYTILRGSSPLSILSHASESGTSSDAAISMPESSPTNRGQYLIAAVTRSSANGDIPADVSISPGWDLRSAASSPSLPLRVACATREAVNETDVQGTWSFSPGASSPGWRTIQLVIGYT